MGSMWQQIVGTSITATNEQLNSFSQAGAYNAQAQIARNNAIIARQNASYAAQEGDARGEQLGLRTRGVVGEIAARQAGSGLNPNTGSALDVRQSAGMLGSLDALTARSQAARQAYGYQVKAQQYDIEQQQARKAAKIAPWVGALNALGSVFGAGSKLQTEGELSNLSGGSGGGGGGGFLDSLLGSSSSTASSGGASSASDYEAMAGGSDFQGFVGGF